MELTGTIKEIIPSFMDSPWRLTLEIEEAAVLRQGYEELKNEKLNIKITKFKRKRSKNANALMWHCIGKIAMAMRTSAWKVYIDMLKSYGKFTYVCVKPYAVDAVKRQWRECEEVGEVEINGQKAIQLLCYFGSSHYDSTEFSALLDGIAIEMQEIGLQPPTSREMARSIELWEKELEKRRNLERST